MSTFEQQLQYKIEAIGHAIIHGVGMKLDDLSDDQYSLFKLECLRQFQLHLNEEELKWYVRMLSHPIIHKEQEIRRKFSGEFDRFEYLKSVDEQAYDQKYIECVCLHMTVKEVIEYRDLILSDIYQKIIRVGYFISANLMETLKKLQAGSAAAYMN